MRPCGVRFAISVLAAQRQSASRITASQKSRVFTANMASKRKLEYTSQIPKEQPDDEADDVLFSSLYGVRTIELNRPKKLNSLNGSMARKILPRLREWEKSDMANVIMITGAGEKAFCAGGDVAELAKFNATLEGQKKSAAYFATEYQLDHLISTYSKPYIAVMDGITMGGGVGLSVHAPFRIATEKTVFAMPETTIGFFPDVGGGFFLSRLDGEIGTYLALTSERLAGVQTVYAGIATHYLDSSVLQPLTTRLSELSFKDSASLKDRLKLIESTLAEFSTDFPSPDSYPKSPYGNIVGELREAVDRCFKYDSVSEILDALRKEAESAGKIGEWAQQTAKTIAKRSPTSLKVTLRQLRSGANWRIGETFLNEHEMAARFATHPDFTEGVTALLINKPATQPDWKPATLDEVSEKDVDSFFELPQGFEPMRLIQPSENAQNDFHDYPFGYFALPRQFDIEKVVKDYGHKGKEAVIRQVLKEWNNKVGTKEKVTEVLGRKCGEEDGKLVWKDEKLQANL